MSERSTSEHIVWSNEVVRNIFIYSFLAWSTKNIYDENVFTGYLFNLVDHHNAEVGFVAGVSGLTMVLLAPGLGVISDKYGRIVLLRAGTVLGFCALSLMMYAITIDSYDAILVVQCIFGAYWACTSPTMDALLADWTDAGTRSKIYTARLTVVQMASTVGPLLSIALFSFLGNAWDMDICRNVMYVGLTLFVIPASLLYFLFPQRFDNNGCESADRSKGGSSEGAAAYGHLPTQSSHAEDEEDSGVELSVARRLQLDGEEDDVEASATDEDGVPEAERRHAEAVFSPISGSISSSSSSSSSNVALQVQVQANAEFDETTAEYCTPYCLRSVLWIPAMIACYEIVLMLASGMTVKFFPIFFLHVLRLDPIHVQFIYLCNPLLTATAAACMTRCSKKHGRIEVTVVVTVTGISMLMLLAYLTHLTEESQKANPGEVENTGWTVLMIGIFLCRSSIMNSTKPLTKSILMDFVPKNQRGKWNALQSVNVFSWAGSAVIGGYLIDRFGFAGIFGATGLMQLCATIPLLLVRRHIPMEVGER